ncbi:MAG TPA: amidohydrolase [Acidobacteriota bacterium]|nr:amidohydrolase [Acidobacteriota bacterium]
MFVSSGPELIVSRGKLYAGIDIPVRPTAMAVDAGKIKAVGDADEIEALRGPDTRFINLHDATVLPGFSDCHTHFFEGALSHAVDLSDVSDQDDFRERVRAALEELPEGEWLVGGYWNEERWGGELPEKSWIDYISSRNPVLLHRQDFHTALCNTSALAASGIDRFTQDPEGGKILRDVDGNPTGMLIEAAVKPVKEAVPPPSIEAVRSALCRWMQHANSVGITHISDMVRGPEEFGVYLDLERDGLLTCRFDLYMPLRFWERFARAGLRSGVGLDLVHLGGMKAFVDGSLGSRTALMLEPYDDDPGNMGMLSDLADPPGELGAMMLCADRAGFQLAVHAIGDAANKILLDLFEKVREGSPYPYLRHRVEHAQHLDPADIRRFCALELIASVQPSHLCDDGCYAEQRIGRDRCLNAYPFHSLIDNGTRLVFGSDWPVVAMGPLHAVWAAITRRTADGANQDGWVAAQKITLEEALEASSRNAAFATGNENIWGMLQPGMDADFIVLDRDIFSCNPGEIRESRVKFTFLKGSQVYPELER